MGSESLGRLAGKRVLITGASSGIGKALALSFAKEGAAVALGANQRASQAQQIAHSISVVGGKAIVVVGDLVSNQDTDRIVDEAVNGLGGLDTFVHCAGVDVLQTAPVHETSDEIWNQMITVNLTSIGKRKDGRIRNYSVDQIGHNKVYIYTDSDDNIYDYYYTIFAERKDVSKLVIERDME